MENTIHRMTGATAERFGLPRRGYIRPGYFADLTAFSEAELKEATPDRQKSFGIHKVWINGKTVLDGEMLDRELAKTSGRAIFI